MGVLSDTMRMGASQPSTASYRVERSLRAHAGAGNHHLDRTPSNIGDTRCWTWAGWFKRIKAKSSSTYQQKIFSCDDTDIYIEGDKLSFGNAGANNLVTNALFRDFSAWYHLVVAVDTRLSTADDRNRMWINGKEVTSFSTRSNLSQYQETDISTAQRHAVCNNKNNSHLFGGYLADIHLIDGLALPPSAFGEFDSANVWQPKEFALPSINNGSTWSGMMTSETGSWYSSSNVNLFNGILGQGSAGQTASASAEDKWIKFTPTGGLEFKQGVRVQHWPGGNSPYLQVKYTLKLTDGREYILDVSSSNGSNAFFTIYEGSGTIEYIQQVCSNNQFNNWGALEVDGVMLEDGKTDMSERNNPNNGTTWSSNGSVSGNSTSATKTFDLLFNGKLDEYAEQSGDNVTLTWTPSPAITVKNKMRIYFLVGGDPDDTVINGDATAINVDPATGWTDVTVPSGGMSFSKLEMKRGGSGVYARASAIEIDGQVLIDTASDNTTRLRFNNTSSIGEDSINSNDYTVADFDSNDLSYDSPQTYQDDGEIERGNYCHWNPLVFGSSESDSQQQRIVNGGLTFWANNNWRSTTGTFAVDSGKWYYEAKIVGNTYGTVAPNNMAMAIGWCQANEPITDEDMYNSANQRVRTVCMWNTGGYNNFGAYQGTVCTPANGNTIGVALDKDNNTIKFYLNNTEELSLTLGDTTSTLVPFVVAYYQDSFEMNFGQFNFTYTPPTGFKRLCSYNISDLGSGDDVNNAQKYFDVLSWTGDGTNNRTNREFRFQPDMLWMKARSFNNAHLMYDAIRGPTKIWYPDLNNDEDTYSVSLQSFDTNGFTWGSDDYGNKNNNTFNFYCWDAGTSAATASTDGTITPSAQWVNTTSGLSISKYTGTGSAATIGHGLNAKPHFIIIKRLEGDAYTECYHVSTGAENVMYLTVSDAATDSSASFNDTEPTNTVFSVGNSSGTNSSGDAFISYAFRPVEGFSKFGEYVGTGQVDGNFIYCGFAPAFVLLRKYHAAGDWSMWTKENDPHNMRRYSLSADVSSAETDWSSEGLDFLSNGFKFRTNIGAINNPAGTHQFIYMAWAETPFKTSRAVM